MDRHSHEGSWGRFHSFNGTMQRPNAPPSLTLASPRSNRSYTLDTPGLASPRQSPATPKTAPLNGRVVPGLRLEPASTTSSDFPVGSVTSLSQMSTKSSYESFGLGGRSGSSETVRAVAARPEDETTIDTPSTQRFNVEEACANERSPLQRDYSPFTHPRRSYGSLIGRGSPSRGPSSVVMSTKCRRMLPSIMHGVILAIQGAVTLAVFSALIWVTIWKKSDSDPEFWNW